MKKLDVFLLIALAFFCFSGTAYAKCQIQYTGKAAKMFGSAPRGNFATKQQCIDYWKSRPAFERANSHCRCSAGSSSGGSGSSGNFQQQIFTGLMNSFMQGFNQGMSGPSPQQKAILKKQQKQKQKEHWANCREQIKKFQQKYNKMAASEFEKNRDNLLSDFKSRFAATIGKKETIKAIQELNCSAYWGVKAAGMALDGKDEFARVYSEYSARAKTDESLLGNCPEIRVEIPPVGAPQPATFQKDFYQFIVGKADDLLPVIHDLKERKKKYADIITSKKEEIKDLEKNRDTLSKEKDNNNIDGLLNDAYKVLNEAMEEDEKAEAGLKEAEKKLDALKEMRGFYDLANADERKAKNE